MRGLTWMHRLVQSQNWVVLEGGQSWQNRQRTKKKKMQTEREPQCCKTKWCYVEREVMGVRWWMDEELHKWGANTVWYRDKRSGMCARRRLPYLNLGSQYLKVPTVEWVLLLLSPLSLTYAEYFLYAAVLRTVNIRQPLVFALLYLLSNQISSYSAIFSCALMPCFLPVFAPPFQSYLYPV